MRYTLTSTFVLLFICGISAQQVNTSPAPQRDHIDEQAAPVALDDTWHMSPNPTTERVRLELPAEATMVHLLDAQGNMMRQFQPSPILDIDMRTMRPGIYTVRVFAGKSVSARRLVYRP